MARKLPWVVNDAPAAKRSRPDPPAHPKPTSHNPADEDRVLLPPNRGRAHEADTQRGSRLRTPSTSPVRSPVRAPPPSVELMRKGYDDDDVYIMVEDEFQSLAQSYTAHLHEAEYLRVKREARSKRKELPEPTSPMSKEAKRRLQSAALQKKQAEVLDQTAGKSPTEQDEDRTADLFSGTSLAPLMAQSSQQKRSLVGLERVQSTTRAGLGYSRPRPPRSSIHDIDGAMPEDDHVDDDDDDEIPDKDDNVLDKKKSNGKSIKLKDQGFGSNFMAKRKREREKEKEKEKEKRSRLDDVPMFSI